VDKQVVKWSPPVSWVNIGRAIGTLRVRGQKLPCPNSSPSAAKDSYKSAILAATLSQPMPSARRRAEGMGWERVAARIADLYNALAADRLDQEQRSF